MHSRQLTPTTQYDENSLGLVNDQALCFRTLPDGSIPLKANWVDLFQSLGQLKSYYLQSRHMGCRLIKKTAPLEVFWVKENALARDRNGELILHKAKAFRTSAMIDRCDCCGSAGRISLYNPYNLEIMQFCSSIEEDVEDWAQAVANCTRHTSNSEASPNPPHLPMIPPEAEVLRFDSGTSSRLLVDFFQTKTTCHITLVTTGISHSTNIIPTSTRWTIDLVEVFGDNITIQLATASVSEVYVVQNDNRLSLLVGSRDHFQLLSIGPPEDPNLQKKYHSVLVQLLKEKCDWAPDY